MNKQEAMQTLKDDIIINDVCPVLRASAIQLVMGDGSLDADIMFVGEAPGRKEDESGLPFVGASGKFLDEILGLSGMNRADVYVTSIVKYRPPNNRDPSASEKAEFWPYLLRQLAIIKPKIIVTLGRHSGMAFIPELIISNDHGVERPVQVGDVTYLVLPLYHPAAALYNGSLRQILADDFSRIPAMLAKY